MHSKIACAYVVNSTKYWFQCELFVVEINLDTSVNYVQKFKINFTKLNENNTLLR